MTPRIDNQSEDYLQTYEEGGIYQDLSYGGPYVSKGVKFADFIAREFPQGSKVLCVGCGNGFEVVHLLHKKMNAYGTELHKVPDIPILKGRILKALVPNLPFEDKEFDLLFCTEVLEHIPEELTNVFIEECRRVSVRQFFSVATWYDPPYNTHINVHGPEWWVEKIIEMQLKLINLQICPRFDVMLPGNIPWRIRYEAGVTFYCE